MAADVTQGFDGPLVWLHCASPREVNAAKNLAICIRHMRPDIEILVTGASAFSPDIWSVDLPHENPTYVETFLGTWSPVACIWLGGHFQRGLLDPYARRQGLLICANIDTDGLRPRALPFLRSSDAKILDNAAQIYAVSTEAASKLAKLGVLPERITVKGPLQSAPILETVEGTAKFVIGNRPTWTAVGALAEEWPLVIAAHRTVTRKSHMAVLCLRAETQNEIDEIQNIARKFALKTQVMVPEVAPETSSQVVIVPSTTDTPLYQMSAACFIGRSLIDGQRGQFPWAAVGHGCAIAYGPQIGDHLEAYATLAKNGAARMVQDEDSLSNAILKLLQPDMAARMALAAWEIATQGSDVTESIVKQITAHLDEIGV